MDDFQGRFGTLAKSLNGHGQTLTSLSAKLVDLEKELDKFEEWLIPLIERLESADFNDRDIPELEDIIHVCNVRSKVKCIMQ